MASNAFAAYPKDWPACACGEPVLDGHLTCGRVTCDEGGARGRQQRALAVGDLVVVGRSCMGNPAGARAVVVEQYDLGDGASWSLLFENGNHDGFPPRDLEIFECVKAGHVSSLADYRFTSALRLYADWRAGVFAEVWR